MSNERNLEVVHSTEIPIGSRFQSDLLTRREAAAYLGVTPETLAVWASTRRYPLRFVKIGRLSKYRKSDLDAFINSRTINCGHRNSENEIA
ncbi:MAG: helix-turn-helix domain-containing protein [Candidatus Obscuribacterales bacterium]